MDDAKIGNFERPVAANLPKPKPSPVEQRFEGAESQLQKEETKAEEALKPRESYEQRLNAAGLTMDDAALIVDAILEKGFWEEDVRITTKKKATFRSRQAFDAERVNTVLEVLKPAFNTTMQEITYKYLLASSISRYDNMIFDFPTAKTNKDEREKLFEKRLNWVDGLPDPLLRLLYQKLSKFDMKIAAVTDEGAIENF